MERLFALGAKAHAHTLMPLPGTPLRRAAPGAIGDTARARIESFEGAGRLFGQWRRQGEIARELARRRAIAGDPRR